MGAVPVDGETKCPNGHVAAAPGEGVPDHCPVCGTRTRLAHSFFYGLGVGFLACVGVSILEFVLLPVTTYASWGLLVLFGAIPLVFLVSGSTGGLLMKTRYGNAAGFGSFLGGTAVVVFVFTVLWGIFIFIIALMLSCGMGTC